jgi:ABC-type dipeptide/oligopeptide/nickel transport system ATPase component
VKAVDGMSFHVDEKETFGLVGESACGKTVTGLSLLRLLPEPAGKVVKHKIILNGRNILELSKKEMRKVKANHQIKCHHHV